MTQNSKPIKLFFDIETDGLLDMVTKVHCMSYAIDDGPVELLTSYAEIEPIVRLMEQPHVLTVAHNGISFDFEVLRRFFGLEVDKVNAFDTLVVSRFVSPDMSPEDDMLRRINILPARLMGSHSLEAWGCRLGEPVDDYDLGWEEYNETMGKYCKQDSVVLRKLYKHLVKEGIAKGPFELETKVQKIIQRQIRKGVEFDISKALILYADLSNRERELSAILAKAIKPWWQPEKGIFTPKRNDSRLGYTAGAKVQKMKLVTFNPNSAVHILRYLSQFDWEPEKFTDAGNPSVDEEVLAGLNYPLIDIIMRHRLIKKRMGMISDGRNGWLKLTKDGKIHGNVNTCGAVTGRMTHSSPNLAQVPSVSHGVDAEGNEGPLKGEAGSWGYEMRELFTVGHGNVLVGCDASGLELRMLAHFLGQYDGGEYAREIIEGDIHTKNQIAAGLSCRETAKTFIYGFLYGGGDAKIGSIVGGSSNEGAALKKRFLAEVPALARLIKALEAAFTTQGYIRGLDRRKLFIGANLDSKALPGRVWQRSNHKALNTLLQSAGALVMKQALVILDEDLQSKGLVPGTDYEFVLNIHDEFQIEVKKEYGELVGEAARQSIVDAGVHFNLRCPLDGEYRIGKSWAETH